MMKKKYLKGLSFLPTLQLIKDSQQYPLNLYLIYTEEDIDREALNSDNFHFYKNLN